MSAVYEGLRPDGHVIAEQQGNDGYIAEEEAMGTVL